MTTKDNPERQPGPDLDEMMKKLPPPLDPETRSGLGHGVEVIGMAACDDVTVASLAQAVASRGSGTERVHFLPVITSNEKDAGLTFLDGIRDLLSRNGLFSFNGDQDLSEVLLVRPIKDGYGGKLVYFLTTDKKGNAVIHNVDDYVEHGRLTDEKIRAFCAQFESGQLDDMEVVTIPVDPEELDWNSLRLALLQKQLDNPGSLTDEQLVHCERYLGALQIIGRGEQKAYIAGKKRVVDIKDFIHYDESTGEHYVAFTIPKQKPPKETDDEEAAKMKKYYCQIYLTCASDHEAEVISKHLLESKLATCAKKIPVNSVFRWKGKIDTNNEILLIMDSREDLFEKTEKVISRLHSYNTFVLQSVRTDKVSKDAKAWMEKELR